MIIFGLTYLTVTSNCEYGTVPVVTGKGALVSTGNGPIATCDDDSTLKGYTTNAGNCFYCIKDNQVQCVATQSVGSCGQPSASFCPRKTECQPCAIGTYYAYTDNGGACVSCPAGQFSGPPDVTCPKEHPFLLQKCDDTGSDCGWYCYASRSMQQGVCKCNCQGCGQSLEDAQTCGTHKCPTDEDAIEGKGSLNKTAITAAGLTAPTYSIGCKYCPPGKYAPASGMTKCVECPAGTYQPNPGHTSCLYCVTSTKKGSKVCEDCQDGNYWGHRTIGVNDGPSDDKYTETQYPWDDNDPDLMCTNLISPALTNKLNYALNGKNQQEADHDEFNKIFKYGKDQIHFLPNTQDIPEAWSGPRTDLPTIDGLAGNDQLPFASLEMRNWYMCGRWSGSPGLYKDCGIVAREFQQSADQTELYNLTYGVGDTTRGIPKNGDNTYKIPDMLYSRPVTWLFGAFKQDGVHSLTYAANMQVVRSNSLYYAFKHPIRTHTCREKSKYAGYMDALVNDIYPWPDQLKPSSTCPECPPGRFLINHFPPPEKRKDAVFLPKEYPRQSPNDVTASFFAEFTYPDRSWPIERPDQVFAGCQPCDIFGYGMAHLKNPSTFDFSAPLRDGIDGNFTYDPQNANACVKCTPGKYSELVPDTDTYRCVACAAKSVTLAPPSGTTWLDYKPTPCTQCPTYIDCDGKTKTDSCPILELHTDNNIWPYVNATNVKCVCDPTQIYDPYSGTCGDCRDSKLTPGAFKPATPSEELEPGLLLTVGSFGPSFNGKRAAEELENAEPPPLPVTYNILDNADGPDYASPLSTFWSSVRNPANLHQPNYTLPPSKEFSRQHVNNIKLEQLQGKTVSQVDPDFGIWQATYVKSEIGTLHAFGYDSDIQHAHVESPNEVETMTFNKATPWKEVTDKDFKNRFNDNTTKSNLAAWMFQWNQFNDDDHKTQVCLQPTLCSNTFNLTREGGKGFDDVECMSAYTGQQIMWEAQIPGLWMNEHVINDEWLTKNICSLGDALGTATCEKSTGTNKHTSSCDEWRKRICPNSEQSTYAVTTGYGYKQATATTWFPSTKGGLFHVILDNFRICKTFAPMLMRSIGGYYCTLQPVNRWPYGNSESSKTANLFEAPGTSDAYFWRTCTVDSGGPSQTLPCTVHCMLRPGNQYDEVAANGFQKKAQYAWRQTDAGETFLLDTVSQFKGQKGLGKSPQQYWKERNEDCHSKSKSNQICPVPVLSQGPGEVHMVLAKDSLASKQWFQNVSFAYDFPNFNFDDGTSPQTWTIHLSDFTGKVDEDIRQWTQQRPGIMREGAAVVARASHQMWNYANSSGSKGDFIYHSVPFVTPYGPPSSNCPYAGYEFQGSSHDTTDSKTSKCTQHKKTPMARGYFFNAHTKSTALSIFQRCESLPQAMTGNRYKDNNQWPWMLSTYVGQNPNDDGMDAVTSCGMKAKIDNVSPTVLSQAEAPYTQDQETGAIRGAQLYAPSVELYHNADIPNAQRGDFPDYGHILKSAADIVLRQYANINISPDQNEMWTGNTVASVNDCIQKCLNSAECKAIVMDAKMTCWGKSVISPRTVQDGITSYVIDKSREVGDGVRLGIDMTTTMTTCSLAVTPKTQCPAGTFFVLRPGWFLENYRRKAPLQFHTSGGEQGLQSVAAEGVSPDRLSSATRGRQYVVPDAWCEDRCDKCPAGKYQPKPVNVTKFGWGASYESDNSWPNNTQVTSPVRKSMVYGDSSHFCLSCPAGKYSGTDGATLCTTCPAGKFSDNSDQAACKTCEMGKHNKIYGARSCVTCPSGQYGNIEVQHGVTATQACVKCSAGQYVTRKVLNDGDFPTDTEVCTLWNDATAAESCAGGQHAWIKNTQLLSKCTISGIAILNITFDAVQQACYAFMGCPFGYYSKSHESQADLKFKSCYLATKTMSAPEGECYYGRTFLSTENPTYHEFTSNPVTNHQTFGPTFPNPTWCKKACDSNAMCLGCVCDSVGCQMTAFLGISYNWNDQTISVKDMTTFTIFPDFYQIQPKAVSLARCGSNAPKIHPKLPHDETPLVYTSQFKPELGISYSRTYISTEFRDPIYVPDALMDQWMQTSVDTGVTVKFDFHTCMQPHRACNLNKPYAMTCGTPGNLVSLESLAQMKCCEHPWSSGQCSCDSEELAPEKLESYDADNDCLHCGTNGYCLKKRIELPAFEHKNIPGLWIASQLVYCEENANVGTDGCYFGFNGLLMYGFSIHNGQRQPGPVVPVYLDEAYYAPTFKFSTLQNNLLMPQLYRSAGLLSAAWSSPFARTAVHWPHVQQHTPTDITVNLPYGCFTCPSGQYSTAGAEKCENCEKGRYTPHPGIATCKSCEAGKYQDEDGRSDCKDCPTGKFQQLLESNECMFCEAGKHQILTGQSTCTPCSIKGNEACYVLKKADEASTQSCDMTKSDCALASFENSSNASKFVLDGKKCVDGNTGMQVCRASGNANVQQDETTELQWECTLGGLQEKCQSTNCKACSPGTYIDKSNTHRFTCKNCPAATFQPFAGQQSCIVCPEGTAPKSDTREGISDITEACDSCPGGQYCTQNCPADLASNVMKCYITKGKPGTACCKCPGGQYSSGGTLQCIECAQGKYSNPASTECTPCAKGYYSDQIGQKTCKSCPTGQTTQAKGELACEQCPDGKYADTDNHMCKDCPRGEYSTKGETCKNCPSGKYQDISSQSACVECPEGQFNPGPAAAVTCLGCPDGQFQSQKGQGGCNKCPAGKYSSLDTDLRTIQCTSCAKGQYNSGDGASSCIACPVGKFSNTTASTSCTNCEAGTVANKDKSKCDVCKIGTFAVSGQAACQNCPKGKYGNHPKATMCIACPSGTYSSSVAQTKCDLCPSGKYQGNAGASSCDGDGCSYGTVSSVLGANNSAQAHCTACPGGRYSNDDRTNCTHLCPAGRYFTSSLVGNAASGYVPCPDIDLAEAQCQFLGYDGLCDDHEDASCAFVKGPRRSDSCSNRVPDSAFCCFFLETRHCWPCPVQSASSATGADNCNIQCQGATTSSVPNRTSCISCPAGRFRSEGSDACDLCPPLQFQNRTGQTSCRLCPNMNKGEQPTTDHTRCEFCGPGRFLNGTSCETCVIGKYTATGGLQKCTACPNGQFNSIVNNVATPCMLCSPGQFRNAGSPSANCTACPSGKFTSPVYTKVENVARPFLQLRIENPRAFTSEADARHACSTKLSCMGYYENSSHFYIFDVPNRVVSASVRSSHFDAIYTRQLPAGVNSDSADSGYTECFSCGVGEQPTPQQDGCVACAAGKYGQSAGSTCLDCPVGHYSAAKGESACTTCDVGRSTPGAGSSGPCHLCAAGQFYAKSQACTFCPAGKFQSGKGRTGCNRCNSVSFSTGNATSCTNCSSGHEASQDRTACLECKNEQRWISLDQPGCEDCPKSTFGDKTECKPCTVGRYGPGVGKGCIPCQPGRYQDQQGLDTCKVCDPGSFQNSTEAQQCTLCPAGHFTNVVESKLCSKCGTGQYQDTAGATSCKHCTGDKTTDKQGQVSCDVQCNAAPMLKVNVSTGTVYAITNVTDNTTIISSALVSQVSLCNVVLKRGTARSDNNFALSIVWSHVNTTGPYAYMAFVRFDSAPSRRRLQESDSITFDVKYGDMCQYGPFGEYSNCEKTCKTNDTEVVVQSRTRQLIFSHPATSSVCTALVQKRACSVPRCPISCLVSEWSSWNPCLRTCGGGKQKRVRIVTRQNQFNGRGCPQLIQWRDCQTNPCPVDCIARSVYIGACSATCGETGRRQKRFIIDRNSANGGKACPATYGYDPCNRNLPCPGEMANNVNPLIAATVVVFFVSAALIKHALTRQTRIIRKRKGYSVVSTGEKTQPPLSSRQTQIEL